MVLFLPKGIMKDKILVIEDEPSIADTITYALKTEGFDVVSCSTGEAGRSRLKEGGVTLVVLDVGLPDGSGFEWCREIRKDSAIPILFLTARSGEVDRVVGLEIGADDYMVKPFSPRELTARVRAILRRSRTQAPISTTHPQTGAFAVDEERCRISFHGKTLSLSRYEYRLLKAFIESPGRV